MSNKINFSKFIFIQSLDDEEREVKTGEIIKDQVFGILREKNKSTPVDFYNCEDYFDFIKLLQKINDNTNENNIPWIHIDCHGEKDYGLIFKDGTSINWSELSKILAKINIKAKFNLAVCFSACYGAEFLSSINTIHNAPCRLLFGPIDEASPADLLGGFRGLYNKLLISNSLNNAIEFIESIKIDQTYWLGQVSEIWFLTIAIENLKNYSNDQTIQDRARRLRKKLKIEKDIDRSIGYIKRLIKKNSMRQIYENFDIFFAIKEIPENKIRFKWVIDELKNKAEELKNKRIISIDVY